MSDHITIFDTTLRDGEQSLRSSLTLEQKMQIALALETLGVDIIEVGFPASSPGDFESVQKIAQMVQQSRVASLCRAVQSDIDACAQAMQPADNFRIHTFLATSPIHLHSKLKMRFDQAVEKAESAVRYARKFTDDVEFSCEDAARTPIDQLCFIVEKVIAAGARCINIPDTVGHATPEEFGAIISTLKNSVPNIDLATISVHCHNDLGLAVPNTLAAISAGARQVECTINGIGERAGNCALEEIAMVLDTREDFYAAKTQINTREIYSTSKLVSQICEMPVQPNKAIVGSNAFNHSSGIHQDGLLKNRENYEVIAPEKVGVPGHEMNLTSRSGRHAVKHRLQKMGFSESSYDIDKIYQRFVEVADQKGQVYDYDLEVLMYPDRPDLFEPAYELDYLHVNSGSGVITTATVSLKDRSAEVMQSAAPGKGPVEAIYNAIDRIAGFTVHIKDYQLSARSQGRSAQGQVRIKGEYKGRIYHGEGVSEDIVEATAIAYLQVINLVKRSRKLKKHPQEQVYHEQSFEPPLAEIRNIF